MNINEIKKEIVRIANSIDCLSIDFASRNVAEAMGLKWFRLNTKVYIDLGDAIYELYWMNRKHTCIGIREAAFPEQ